MATIKSSTSVSSYSSNGLGGLVSGMDTEEMVNQLLSATQAKIDKQTAVKQQTTWQQDIYRDIITSFQSFQSKFFDILNPKTNLLSSSFFSAKTATANSSAIKVAALNSALSNSMTINRITQLATARKETGGVVSGEVVLNVDIANFTEGSSMSVTLDGITKSIKLNGAATGTFGKDTKEAILANMQTSITKAFGNGIEISVDTGKVTTTAGRQFTLSGDTETKKALGVSGSISNKVNLSTSLKDLNMSTKLVGSAFDFTINGEKFSFTEKSSLSEIMNKINSSAAGVRVSYSSLTDKFSIESTTLGKDISIDMSQESGNVLTAMFGVGSGTTATSYAQNAKTIAPTQEASSEMFQGTFKLNVNGKDYEIELPSNDTMVQEDAIRILNIEMDKLFGEGNVTLTMKDNLVSLNTKPGYLVNVAAGEEGDLGHQLGLAGTSNALSEASTLAELGLLDGSFSIKNSDGQVGYVSYSGSDTIASLKDKFAAQGVAMSFTDGKFTITSDEKNLTVAGTGYNSNASMNQLFGSSKIDFNGNSTATSVIEGQNAILEVNGLAIERNNNNFTIDGFQISLLETSDTAINITAENNTNQIFEGLVSFVDEYNKLIEKINGYTSEKQTYKDYAPLTDAQKSAMSESEIKTWEEKAKEGLLANDALLGGIASQMRSALYSIPNGSNIALYNIGITTSNNYLERGKLVIDEEKLKAAIEKDPAAVSHLFTDSENGLSVAMNKIINNAAKSSIASPGSLVQRAGVKNTVSATQNNLTKKMESIDKVITQLKERYEMEKTRYWKQFNAMESIINKTNSQSSWLMSQFSTS